MLHVRLLGELQAELGGRPIVPPPSRRAWELLAWLALHPGEHPRGAVAARFWPDVLDSSARASLRSAAWALRRALGPGDALIAGRDRIGLVCDTDLAQFDAHCAAGRLAEAVALHRGPLLADLDEDWVLEARDEHADRVGAALARLAAGAAPTEAVAYARRRLALDPLDEEAARDLMRRQAKAGDRAAALATYDRLGDRLRTALGLATSAETRALAVEIRGRESAITDEERSPSAPESPGTQDAASRRAGTGSGDAAGRGDAAGPGDGTGRSDVPGPGDGTGRSDAGGPGDGPGRCDAVGPGDAAGRADGPTTGRGASNGGDAGRPNTDGWAARREERAHQGAGGGSGLASSRGDRPFVGRVSERAALVRVCGGLRDGAGAVVLITGEAGMGKTRLAEEVLAVAQPAYVGRATALDLGGGSPPFGLWAELLAGLARRLAPPHADSDWPEELARLAPALPRRLGRRPRPATSVPADLARARLFEAAVELAEHATETRPLVLLFDDVHLADSPTLELTAYVARRIADLPVLLVLTRRPNPRSDAVDALLHAAEAARTTTCQLELEPLAARDIEALVGPRPDVIAAAEGNPLLALESARATERPPASLRGMVRAAIACLDVDARQTAEVAAVAGRDLDRTELAALATPEAVMQATDCGLFKSADGRFGYRHALLREAVYSDLDDARRTAHHERLGHALANAAESAHHLTVAGRGDLAAGRLKQAAQDATRATALEQAAEFLAQAAQLEPDPDTYLRLAETWAQLGDRERSDDAFDRAKPHNARAHLKAAQWFHSTLCDPASALQSARQGLMAPELDLDTRVELLLVRGWAEVVSIGAAAAYATLAEVEALGVDLTTDPLRRHHLENLRGFIALAEGRLQDAEAELVASGEAGESAGRADFAYGGWANASCVASAAGAHDRALVHAERGAALVSTLPVVEFQVTGLRAAALARLGRHDEARAFANRHAELAARLASAELQAMADHDNGLLALAAHDYERAAALLENALRQDPPIQRADARLRRAEALARLGRADEADAEIRKATSEPVRAADRPGVLVARMAFAQALSAKARGDDALADRRLREAEGHWRRLQVDAGGELLASLMDLGRPTVTGVVDPAHELRCIHKEARPDARVR